MKIISLTKCEDTRDGQPVWRAVTDSHLAKSQTYWFNPARVINFSVGHLAGQLTPQGISLLQTLSSIEGLQGIRFISEKDGAIRLRSILIELHIGVDEEAVLQNIRQAIASC